MQFKNPSNGHIEDKSIPALWCALFGPFYFLVSGIWIHALLMVILAMIFIAWLGPPATLLILAMDVIYCIFAPSIVENFYLRKGWERVTDAPKADANFSSVAEKTFAPATEKKCPFCAETIRYEAIKCKHCGSDLTKAAVVDPKQPLNDYDGLV